MQRNECNGGHWTGKQCGTKYDAHHAISYVRHYWRQKLSKASRNRCSSRHSHQNGSSCFCHAFFKAVETCTFYDIHNVFNHTHSQSDPDIMGATLKARVKGKGKGKGHPATGQGGPRGSG